MQNELGFRVEYAAGRWARAVVAVAPLAEDVPTLPHWARATHSSVGALRAVCRAAHVSAKPSLDFARVLRAVLQGRQLREWDPANLLDVRHERTLARLVREGGTETGDQTRYVSEIKDPFGNRVTFEYFTSGIGIEGVKKITQYLSTTETRVVTFTIDTALRNSLSTMTYNGRVWRYEHTTAGSGGHTRLVRVWYPDNTSSAADWDYSYGGHNGWELTRVRYPSGGTVSYTYAEVTRVAQNYGMNYRVVTSRATAGPSIAAGTWTIAYDQGTSKDWTFVTGPITTHKYRYWGVGNGSDYSAWIKGALRDYRIEAGGVLLQRTVNTYLKSRHGLV